MTRLRDEQGFVLVSAIVLLTVILGLGLGLLLFTDNEQKASAREQASESAFNVAEAALNAQVGQVSRAWPAKVGEEYPARCTATESTPNGCPTPGSLNVGYPNISPVACPAGTPKDAWGSPLTNEWTTYVRDDAEKSQYFNSTTEKTQPRYDVNEDEKLWVRAVGVVQCRVVTLITLVSRQQVAINFPKAAASGNWFKVTNSGKKTIVNTEGIPAEQKNGEVSMRCSELGSTPCEEWIKAKEQIAPDTTKAPPTPTPILNEVQTAALKAQAEAAGTFHSAALGNCPTTLEQTSGLPAYIEGCGNLHFTGGVGNSAENPGFLVLADGTLELNGGSEFYGVIYARNPTNLSTAVVSLGGTTTVFGAIDVDGNGGIEFGSSAANLIYNAKAILNLKTYAGATPTRNTFRVLPNGQ
jgi:Tfp pilus assembly protein PilX